MNRSFWRHPKPIGVQGFCVGGHFDPPVDRRKARRLAHRIRAHVRRHGLPRTVHVSPLQRCRAVGLQLQAWGWQLVIDEGLREVSFGDWEGRPWSDIGREALDAWVADFPGHAPGGGESVQALIERVRRVLAALPPQVQVVAHGGWIAAAQCVFEARTVQGAQDWPVPRPYGGRLDEMSS